MPTPALSPTQLEELQLLSRAIEGRTFHFVLVQWGHRSLVARTIAHLCRRYPERPGLRLSLADTNYDDLLEQILTHERGLVFLDQFEHLLEDPERYIAFNQRRGMFTRLPLTLVAFLPPGDAYVKQCRDHLPDWWSILTFLAQLPQKQSTPAHQPRQLPGRSPASGHSTLGGDNPSERLQEIKELQARLIEIEPVPENAALLHSLYRPLLELCETAGLYQLGHTEADYWLKAAVELGWAKTDPKVYAEILDRLGRFEQLLGNYDRAARLKKEALRIIKAEYPDGDAQIARQQNNLAGVYKDLGEYEQARALLEQALQSDLDHFGPDHPTTAIRRSNLALVYKDLGEYEQARALLEQALESALDHFGPDHPETAIRRSNLATVYKDLGEYEQARALLEQALESALHHFGPDHPTTAISQLNLGTVLLELGQTETARELIRTAYQVFRRQLGETHPETTNAKSWLTSFEE